jgi:hypothetical protein
VVKVSGGRIYVAKRQLAKPRRRCDDRTEKDCKEYIALTWTGLI